jgi:uncharacterized membrane protein
VNTARENISEYKRKYEIFRHHAWAGTAFLSVLLALQYLVTSIPRYIFIPVGTLLILYILIAVVLTYRYRAGLSKIEDLDQAVESSRMGKSQTPQPDSLKIEKKRVKSEAKARKKEQKALAKSSEKIRQKS